MTMNQLRKTYINYHLRKTFIILFFLLKKDTNYIIFEIIYLLHNIFFFNLLILKCFFFSFCFVYYKKYLIKIKPFEEINIFDFILEPFCFMDFLWLIKH